MSWRKKTIIILMVFLILLSCQLSGIERAIGPQPAMTTKTQAQALRKNHPVILIHGLGGRWDRWDDSTIWKTLREDSYNMDLVVRFKYPLKSDGAEDSCGDVAEMARELEREIDRLSAESQRLGGPAEVDIIGHSLGGLITRQYLSAHLNDHKVRKFIEIGTPNLGTWYLEDFPGSLREAVAGTILRPLLPCDPRSQAVQQLDRKGPFLSSLNQASKSPGDLDYSTVYGQIKIIVEMKIFFWTVTSREVSIGDSLVPIKSATTIPGVGSLSQRGNPRYHPCDYKCSIPSPKAIVSIDRATPSFSILNLDALLLEIRRSPCQHSGLVENDEVNRRILEILNEGFVEPPPAPPGVAPTISAATSTALVIDISGSMANFWQGGIKIESARSAATQIVNMMESESQVGGISHEVAVATFSTDAYLDLPLTSDFDEARNTISWLGTVANTNIGAGLTVANEELESADPQSSRFIILLSDGMTNEGLLPDEIISGPVREARDAGACIYTIGFGDQGDIDEDLLRRIARESACGEYYYATDTYRLESVYVEIRHRALGNIVGNFSGYVGQGETDPVGQVTVEPGQDQLAATLNWRGSRLDLIVTDPTGRQVDEGYPGASIFIDARPVYFIIENPKPGVWEVAVAGIDVPEGITDYNVILSTREGVIPPPTDNTGLILVVMAAMVCLVVGFVILTTRQPAAGVVVAGVEPATLVGFRRGLLTIGRGSRNNMPLSDPKVSRNHAQIRRTPQGYMIHDLNTTNGTFVNEEKITSQILRDGDEIRVGDTRLQFRSRR